MGIERYEGPKMTEVATTTRMTEDDKLARDVEMMRQREHEDKAIREMMTTIRSAIATIRSVMAMIRSMMTTIRSMITTRQ